MCRLLSCGMLVLRTSSGATPFALSGDCTQKRLVNSGTSNQTQTVRIACCTRSGAVSDAHCLCLPYVSVGAKQPSATTAPAVRRRRPCNCCPRSQTRERRSGAFCPPRCRAARLCAPGQWHSPIYCVCGYGVKIRRCKTAFLH